MFIKKQNKLKQRNNIQQEAIFLSLSCNPGDDYSSGTDIVDVDCVDAFETQTKSCRPTWDKN